MRLLGALDMAITHLGVFDMKFAFMSTTLSESMLSQHFK